LISILALDPSLTATGLAVLRLSLEDGEWAWRVAHVECVRTEPDARSRHLYQADQDGQRVDKIATAILAAIDRHRPSLAATEAPAGSQHAISAKAFGLAYGCVRAACVSRRLPVLTVQAHEARIAATGTKSASKDNVGAAMAMRFCFDIQGTKVAREAIGDALAVGAVAVQSDTARSLVETLSQRSS
jgi:Holliday junction resolvasome RuvABC endonuclease subunit